MLKIQRFQAEYFKNPGKLVYSCLSATTIKTNLKLFAVLTSVCNADQTIEFLAKKNIRR